MGLPTNNASARAWYLAAAALVVMTAGCESATPDFEYTYLPGTETESAANLPFTPAIMLHQLFLKHTAGLNE